MLVACFLNDFNEIKAQLELNKPFQIILLMQIKIKQNRKIGN